jgi:hypothetical protein
MAARLAPGDYDRLHHFIADGVWDALENWLNHLGRGVTIERVIQDHGERLNPETLSYIAHLLQTRLQ